MNRLLHTRRRVLMLGAAGVACVGLLTAGVANAASPGPSTSNPAGVPGGKGKVAKTMKEIRQQLRSGAVHGEVTVDTKKGIQTVDFQRGTVAQLSSGGFQVTDSSGLSESWVIGPKTKVRELGQHKAGVTSTPSTPSTQSAPAATISNGENVVVIGLKTAGTLTARIVVVLPTNGALPGRGAGPAAALAVT
jgi:hypothetical protein